MRTINEHGNNVVMAVNTRLTLLVQELSLQSKIVLLPVGQVRGGRLQPEDDSWESEICTIVMDDRFEPEALTGLGGFSHIEVVFHFHRVPENEVQMGARHPRGRTDWPLVGIFAQRAKARPGRIGVTVCQLLSVDGRTVTVRGLDAIDGTPVLDIKPVMTSFLPRGDLVEPDWARELMKDYW